MTTSFNGITDTTLQKLLDRFITTIVFNGGTSPAAAPNAIKDRFGKVVFDKSTDVTMTIRITLGNQAWIRIVPNDGNPGQAIEGQLNVATLATLLS